MNTIIKLAYYKDGDFIISESDENIDNENRFLAIINKIDDKDVSEFCMPRGDISKKAATRFINALGHGKYTITNTINKQTKLTISCNGDTVYIEYINNNLKGGPVARFTIFNAIKYKYTLERFLSSR